jgi:D-glycero-D-manno-heptose 1,7-bisphosphate phosphatase
MTSAPICGHFDESLGMWVRVAGHSSTEPRPALFLDRDGVIIEDPGYLYRPADVRLIPGAAAVISAANRRGLPVVAVSNQSGIGRGYYGLDDFAAVEEALTHLLAQEDASIDAVFACPYHQEGVSPWRHPAHPARKPLPGMLLAAERLLHLDLGRSWIVGDKLSDLQAGYHAGLRGGLHVLTGKGSRQRPLVIQWPPPENFAVLLGDSIRNAEAMLG